MVTERGALLDHWLQPISMLHRKHQETFDAIASEPDQAKRIALVGAGGATAAHRTALADAIMLLLSDKKRALAMGAAGIFSWEP